jgi:hypothetical protein
MKKVLLCVLALIASAPVALEAQLAERLEDAEARAKLALVNEVYQGRDCEREDRSRTFNVLTCTYRVGQDLEFAIEQVGTRNPILRVHKANSQGDFWLSIGFDEQPNPNPNLDGLLGRCLRIMAGANNSRYGELFSVSLSPFSGEVYTGNRDCWDEVRN